LLSPIPFDQGRLLAPTRSLRGCRRQLPSRARSRNEPSRAQVPRTTNRRGELACVEGGAPCGGDLAGISRGGAQDISQRRQGTQTVRSSSTNGGGDANPHCASRRKDALAQGLDLVLAVSRSSDHH